MNQTAESPLKRMPYYQRLLSLWAITLFVSDLDERLPDLARSYCYFFGGFNDYGHIGMVVIVGLIACSVANPMVARDAQAYLPDGARPLTRRTFWSIVLCSVRGTAEILVNARRARRLSTVAFLYLVHFAFSTLALVVMACVFTALVNVGFDDMDYRFLFTNRCALP